jgi:hypothetical protein
MLLIMEIDLWVLEVAGGQGADDIGSNKPKNGS